MRTIFPLPKSVVSKIAAGEVIERPAYAVKELLENAIDARADSISIHIEDAGLKQITISDNGEGMSREDLLECFKPHTTSKIKSEDELLGIKTLGFRGEALASIAAISDLTIKSRQKNETAGTIVEIKFGEVENVSSTGIPAGTTVLVENLFRSVPARKKFLKTTATEFRHISEIVMHYALSFPEIHFVLTHNKKTILDLPKKSDFSNRIKMAFGESFLDQFLPIKHEDGYVRIEGFVGKPQTASHNMNRQYLFINTRNVTDKLISLAVKEAFGTLLPSSSTPVFRLHITIPYELVDVNVHPRKEHVQFSDSRMIFDAVKLAVTEILANNNITFNLAKFKIETSAKISDTVSFAGQLLKETVLPWNQTSLGKTSNHQLIQLHKLYILVPSKEGLVLIDQHAAHERILYEEFLESFESEKKKNFKLSKPVKLELSLSDSQVLEEYMDNFLKSGFQIDHFQAHSFVIRSIPAVFKGRNIQKIVIEMLEEFAQDKTPKSVDTRSQRMLAYLSCRAAVKAGDALSKNQMKSIVKQLEKTLNNATCPHGRPTRITISLSEINKFFKRS